MLHDLRPALLVAGDGRQQVHALRDQLYGALVGAPGVCGGADGVQDGRDALRLVEPGLDGGVVGTERGQTLESQRLHPAVAAVALHHLQQDRDDARIHQSVFAALVLCQLVDHPQRTDRHLRIARVELQGVLHRLHSPGVDDLSGVLGDVGQGRQGRQGVAVDDGVLGVVVHGRDERADAAVLQDLVADLGDLGHGAEVLAAALLQNGVLRPLVHLLDDDGNGAQMVKLPHVLCGGVRSVGEELDAIPAHPRILVELLHGSQHRREAPGLVDVLHP
mmetsp:Transcript_46176/g.109758  ORF Transcript_46176/g.109758 Transcript_46176/m.109758 type:complete len:276 (-) Transcript_46176:58-885(-)